MRSLLNTSSLVAAVALLVGCITIHLNFPRKELERAADEIVNEVRPELAADELPVDPTDDLDRESGLESAIEESRVTGGAGRVLFAAFIKTAYAQDEKKDGKKDEIKLDIDTPKIKKIKAALKKRYRRLLPHYVARRVGEGHLGLLVARDVKSLKLKERRALNALIKAENGNRNDLYAEIAKANDIDAKRVRAIGALFAKSWHKVSKTGWWIELKKGKWEKKKPPKKKIDEKKPDAA